MAEITDPSTELFQLCTMLKGVDSKDVTTRTLAKKFGVDVDSAEFFSTLAAISSRIHRLRSLVASLTDTPQPFRSAFDIACAQAASFLSSTSLTGQWRGVRDAAFKDVALNTLMMAGHTVKKVAPLSVPTASERADIIKKIDEAIEEIQDGNDIFATLLFSSFLTLRVIIERLEFYGVDGLIDHLLNTHVILRSAEASQSDSQKKRGFTRAWNVLATMYFLLTIPDAGITAIENNYARFQVALHFFSKEAPEPNIKLLTGPAKDSEPATTTHDGVALRPQETEVATDGKVADDQDLAE